MNEKRSNTVNSSYLNRLNKISVLRLIRNEGHISRAEIVKRTGLSAPTVTRISGDLIVKEKLVTMVGEGASSGGRRPKMLRFSSRENFVIGIELGTGYIRGALSDLDGKFIVELQVSTGSKGAGEKVMEQIGDIVDTLISRGGDKGAKVLGIGLAEAGSVNGQTAIIERPPVFNWKNVDIINGLKAYTQLPVFCDNVPRLIALGELWYGIGSRYRDFICVDINNGIGAGIIIEGKPFFGANGYAGELGWPIVDDEGNSIGTMEVPLGDGETLKSLDRAIGHLAICLDTLIKLFNPECIVLSGRPLRAKGGLRDRLENEVRKYSVANLSAGARFMGPSFGENAVLMGAFSLILDRVLDLEIGVT
ncbi:ROK family transcriptional regulator [Seonamhaeicola sp.]|uniref:ROK family transcriptional regulator n=1 Tax=Seonamhaeicola sp. TaxID=1912245 RepID=UPI002637E8BA|nr:ROK family transcriptional regulator [Seonamhaeicola sp.]